MSKRRPEFKVRDGDTGFLGLPAPSEAERAAAYQKMGALIGRDIRRPLWTESAIPQAVSVTEVAAWIERAETLIAVDNPDPTTVATVSAVLDGLADGSITVRLSDQAVVLDEILTAASLVAKVAVARRNLQPLSIPSWPR